MPVNSEQAGADQGAFEYWGYLFKSDKTGTDKLKKLLRALHKYISTRFDRYDSNDLTPTQLARFYRELNGDYDQLFLSIPPATIQFIYKNLGCLHSLQPLPAAASVNRFANPTIPALKIEGWIMWETIQLLLGPDEHAGFLMQAVQKWDLCDPDTGEKFPKLLPRRCFPATPDAHMTAWYEGVSERLRREAEEESSMRITAVEEDAPRQIESAERHHQKHARDHNRESDTEAPVETKKSSALSYFKNPLFKNNEGKPGVVRRNSKHPTLVERGMSAASSVGNVVRNIGSPHLWDGLSGANTPREKHGEKEPHHRVKDYGDREQSQSRHDGHREREKDRDHRRRSLPHTQHTRDSSSEEDMPSPRLHPRHVVAASRRNSHTNSPASDREGHEYANSPRRAPPERRSQGQHHPHQQRRSPISPDDHTIRHSKSHDPTPSPKDYFPPYDSYQPKRGSSQQPVQSPGADTASPGRTPVSAMSAVSESAPQKDEGSHTGFMPTASPLFATHIARHDPLRNQGQLPKAHYTSGPPGYERYDSPNRSQMGRSASMRREDPARRGPPNAIKGSPPGVYSSIHTSNMGPPPAPLSTVLQQRPKVTRFDGPATNDAGRVAR